MIGYLKSLKNKTKQPDLLNTYTDPTFFYPHEIITSCKEAFTNALNFDATTHSCDKFTSENNNLNERLSYNLTDDKGNLIFKVFDNDAKRFPVTTPQDLIAKNNDVIDALYRALLMEDDFFKDNILPYIKRAASICLNLPASEGHHDAKPGGLFRHLLCVAFESINLYFDHNDVNDSLKKRNLKCTLFLAGLCHDIAKVITDFSIYNNNNDHFNPYLETLHHFCLRTNALELIVFFNSGRRGKHDELRLIGLSLLTSGLPQIFAYIDAAVTLNDFYLQKSTLFKNVQIADSLCARANAWASGPYTLNINAYLAGLLLNLLNNTDFEDLKDKGIFVVPYGILIAYDSVILNDLNGIARENFLKENKDKQQDWRHLSRHWSKQGYLFVNGTYKVYAWHHVITAPYRYFLYGLTVKFNVRNIQNYKNLLCNAVQLGEAPSLVKDLIKNYRDHFPGILRIDSADTQIIDALKPYADEKDNKEILMEPFFGKGIKEREENAAAQKSLKKQSIENERQQGILDAQEIISKNEFALHSEFKEEKFKTEKLSDSLKIPDFNADDKDSSSLFSLPDNLDEVKNENAEDRIDLAAPENLNNSIHKSSEAFYAQDFKLQSSVRRDLFLKDEKSPYKTTINFPKVQKVKSPSISLKLESWLDDYSQKLVKPLNTNDLENNQEE